MPNLLTSTLACEHLPALPSARARTNIGAIIITYTILGFLLIPIVLLAQKTYSKVHAVASVT